MTNDVPGAEKTEKEFVSVEVRELLSDEVRAKSIEQETNGKKDVEERASDKELWLETSRLPTNEGNLLSGAPSALALSDLSLLLRLETSIFAGLGLFLCFLPRAGRLIQTVGYIAFFICLMVLAW